jgi:alkanesulfonate monooxygenase SsuD/methylene tetrahydromethanopterin reductase-like flavin-dependent oxidoreductase (luciferase family)/hemerythrin-like domain-containing protein
VPPHRPPQFGVFVTPDAAAYPDVLRQVEAAERGGLDLVGIQDHPYQPRFLDTFALIADLLARTDRLRFFPDVANLPLREPAMLAKTGASLDVMSGGRFELGIGAGVFWQGVTAMGGPGRTPGESVEALEEAVEILRRAWRGERAVTVRGKHYTVRGFAPGPPPAHPIGIWIGAYKPRMLRLTGRLGDGWLPSMAYAPPEAIPEMQRRIDEAAEREGRDPRLIRRIYNVGGAILDGPTRELLQGPPSHWIETLADFVLELGFDDFVFAPAGDDPAGQIERFAQEVVPGVREALAAGAAAVPPAPLRVPAPPVRELDEATRPHAPKQPDAEITPAGRRGQEALKGIHDHLRHEMAQVVEVVDAVAAGDIPAEDARALIDKTAMMQNFRWVASFCARYCQVVEIHHTIEDRFMFVNIGDADPTLQPVLDRLGEEHQVIHDILTRLDVLLLGLADAGTRASELAGEVRVLQAALISHLDYEEDELLEPIGRLSIAI